MRGSIYNLLEMGLVEDRLEILAAEEASDQSNPKIVLVGSSRLQRGFRQKRLSKINVSEDRLVKLAHPQLLPFEMRALAERVAALKPEVVVLAISELETHSSIDLRPEGSFTSTGAIGDLIYAAGPKFVFENQTLLLRLLLASLVDFYHYRGVLGHTGLGSLRKFPMSESLKHDPKRPTASGRRKAAMVGNEMPIPEDQLDAMIVAFDARFPASLSMRRRPQFALVRSISTGAHARVNLSLLRRTVEILGKAGSHVILIEPPIYPAARALYDKAARDEFLAFASGLARGEGVSFVPLEDWGDASESNFEDLTHLNRRGALVFSRIVVDAIAKQLGVNPRLPPRK